MCKVIVRYVTQGLRLAKGNAIGGRHPEGGNAVTLKNYPPALPSVGIIRLELLNGDESSAAVNAWYQIEQVGTSRCTGGLFR